MFIIQLMRKDEDGSHYVNQLASGVFTTREDAMLNALRRTRNCSTKIVMENEKHWPEIPVGKTFFFIKELTKE